MRKYKFYDKQIDLENSLKNIGRQISNIPEEELIEKKISLKEYAFEVKQTKDCLQDVLPFYIKLKNISTFLTCGFIGLGLIAIPLIILGLLTGAFTTFCFCKQKKIETYLPFLSQHLCVVNEAIGDIDSFLEEKYEVLNNFDKHKSKTEKVTLINNGFFKKQNQDENEDDNEDNNEDNNGLNL